jgi:lysophospholipase L1-like esterase
VRLAHPVMGAPACFWWSICRRSAAKGPSRVLLPMPSLLFVIGLFLAVSDVAAQDWANLGRFRDANEDLVAAGTVAGRVVFMGDSITEGWDLGDYFPGLPYVNRGISGQTTPQMLVRFRADVLDLRPDVVVILAGTNDIAGNTGPMELTEIADNIKSMAELALANGVMPVIASVLPAADYPWRPGLHPDEKIPALNAMLERYAEQSGVAYLDYFGPMQDGENGLTKTYTTDGVHCTPEGYARMTELANALLERGDR